MMAVHFRTDRHRRGVLRLVLLLAAAFGCLLAGLLIEQRLVTARQRSSLQDLSRIRSDMRRSLLQVLSKDAPDQAGPEAAAALSAFLDTFRRNHLETGAFENKLRALKAGPDSAEDLRARLKAFELADLEADLLVDQIRDRFLTREAHLGRWVNWTLLIQASLSLGACLLAFRLYQEERKLWHALGEREALLRVVVDNLPNSYLYRYEHPPASPPRFVYASSGVERVHGVTPAQVLADPDILLSQLSGKNAGLRLAAEAESARTQSDFTFEVEFRRPDGGTGVLSLRSRPRQLADGGILWDGFASDVTDERRAQVRYDTLFENAFEGIYRTAPSGGLLDVNPSMARAFGYSSPEQMLDECKNAREMYASSADRDTYVQTLKDNGAIREFEFRGRRRDGSLVWISTNARAVHNLSGEIEYYEGTGLDISERKLSLERIRQLNRVHSVRTDINQNILRGLPLQAILDNACSVAVEKGHFQCAWICLFQDGRPGATAGQALPTNLSVELRDCPIIGTALSGEPSFCNDLQQIGPVAWAAEAQQLGYRSVAALPLAEEKRVVGLMTLFSASADFFDPDEILLLTRLAEDLSFALELQTKEQQRLATKEELRVSQEQFRQAQKMESLGQLAGGVAHDFNNILAVIMMQTELLLTGEASPEDVSEGLEEIHSSAGRAANLTRQLLLFSRRQVMQPTDLDLNEVVTQLARMLQRVIGEDIALQLNLCPRPVHIRGDAGMIDQVLVNLAVNSRDAMPTGGVLTISTDERVLNVDDLSQHSEASPGRFCRISVSDTGSGMTPEILEHIFEPFFTTKELGKGTGLGLATVFGIVKQHRGLIEVFSIPSKSTTFQVYLPASQASPGKPLPASQPQAAPRGCERVLLVEDDPRVRLITSRVLRSAGYSVTEAAQGPEGLTCFEEHCEEIDLLLTDLVMPGQMTGRELADRCRERRSDLPVLFMSGYSKSVAGRELELAPGESFLQKPFTPSQILQSVRDTRSKTR